MFIYLLRSSSMMKTCCFSPRFFNSSAPRIPLQLPSKMETHLWYILPNEVKDASILNQCLELLSPSEKENVNHMRGMELKKTALLARALVRTTIARYQINSEVCPRSLKFSKNIHGKPEVEWPKSDDRHPPALRFNLSHTSSLIACGVTMDSSIGIDVEEKQRTIKHDVLSFARRYFSDREVDLLAAIPDPEVQRQEFLKLWTLKEAYVKALGRGFSGAPFKTFTILFRAPTTSLPWNSKSKALEIVVDSFDEPTNFATNWQFSLLELAGSHYAAICKENISPTEGEGSKPMKLTVWKTIPFVEDHCVSGTDSVINISGLA
ncbi:Holo-[acyl-carrier-protein] synthase [Bertholletia excelsa]